MNQIVVAYRRIEPNIPVCPEKLEPTDSIANFWMILETAVGREKDVQDIDVHGRFEKLVVTLLVMRAFSNFPGALRACADFRDPTDLSRIIVHRTKKPDLSLGLFCGASVFTTLMKQKGLVAFPANDQHCR